jgi:hypothetical protein
LAGGLGDDGAGCPGTAESDNQICYTNDECNGTFNNKPCNHFYNNHHNEQMFLILFLLNTLYLFSLINFVKEIYLIHMEALRTVCQNHHCLPAIT